MTQKICITIVSVLIALISIFAGGASGKELIIGRENFSYRVNDQRKLRDHSLSGAALYQLYCSVCHGEKGNGASWTTSSLNPPPANFSDPSLIKRLSRGRMFKSIKEGRKDSAMVGWKIQLTDEEINRIAVYIRKEIMKIKEEKPAEKLSSPDGDFFNGKRLFKRNCAPCHGENGDGNGPRAYFINPKPRNFLERGETISLKNIDFIFSAIKQGIPGSVMPTWGHVLSDKDIMDIAIYVKEAFIDKISGSSSHNNSYTPAAELELDFSAGKRLYEKRCAYCHGKKGDGNGPSAFFIKPQKPRNFLDPLEAVVLDNLNFLFYGIKNGVAGTVMHSWELVLSDKDIMDIAFYVKEAFVKKTVSSFAEEDKNITITGLKGDFSAGKRLYKKRCAPCHGEKGDGNGRRSFFLQPKPRNFLEPYETKHLNKIEVIFAGIKKGIPNTTMPGWGSVLSNEEIMNVAVYIQNAFIKKKY